MQQLINDTSNLVVTSNKLGCNNNCYDEAGRNSYYDKAGRIGILLRILRVGGLNI